MTVDVKIPPFEHTSIDDIGKAAAEARATYRSQKTKDIEWRLTQLRKLYWGFQDHSENLIAALAKDLGKPSVDALTSEINYTCQDLLLAINKLKTWAKDDKDLDYPMSMALLRPRVRKEPMGTVLIIGPYNFPVMLCLSPLTGCIAAGCTAVIKPSENAPATAMAIKQMVESCLDPSAYKVVNGAIPETTALLDQKWDKIFYTGSPNIARIIYKKAAESLTPVTLELGGKNPSFITKSSDVPLAARRLLWGKVANAGQVCTSHNYVLVERELVDGFITALNHQYKTFFPSGAQGSPDYARIINTRQFDRIKKMIDSTKGKIVLGGATDRDTLFIEPTAVLVDSIDDPMMQEESFGPVWSIMPFDNLDQAIRLANEVDHTPLSLMTFGSKAENEKILGAVTSGGATLNDSYMHIGIPTLPFGGIGESGTGAYHGRASYECFTHRRTIVEVPGWMDGLLRVRYLPYSQPDIKRFNKMNAPTIDFDREGRQIRGARYWLWMLFGLGGPTAKGALIRWLLVLASGYATMTYGLTAKSKLV